MSAPTASVRAAVYDRDGRRCVSCGYREGLEFQHRRATGMGGSKVRPEVCDGLTSCSVCNPAYEHHLQALTLLCGWKVRGWVREPDQVPVLALGHWYRLVFDGSRERITKVAAASMMTAVYGDQWLLDRDTYLEGHAEAGVIVMGLKP